MLVLTSQGFLTQSNQEMKMAVEIIRMQVVTPVLYKWFTLKRRNVLPVAYHLDAKPLFFHPHWLIFIFDKFTHSFCEFYSCKIVYGLSLFIEQRSFNRETMKPMTVCCNRDLKFHMPDLTQWAHFINTFLFSYFTKNSPR